MKFTSLRARIALKLSQLALLFFILSLGIYVIVRPVGGPLALLLSGFFFFVSVFLSAYIICAIEFWPLKKLSAGGGGGSGWQDTQAADDLPEEVQEVRDVLVAMKNSKDDAVLSQKRFLADASHEMRSPITIMKGNIEIALRRERDVAEYRRVLESNLEDIDRLEYLVKDLMFLARADASELVVNMAPVRLDEVLHQIWEELLPIAERKGIALGIKLNAGDDSVVEGDRDRLRQLFVNLIENALRYTPAGGSVDIMLKNVLGICTVLVSDTGIGIPASELGRIFDRFYRVDKARSRDSGGTGLGLCICRWIVDAHDGEITIKSEEGAGTTVTVMLLSSFA